MSLPAVGKNFTLKQEQKGRNRWFRKETKLIETFYVPPKYTSLDKEVERMIIEYLENSNNSINDE